MDRHEEFKRAYDAYPTQDNEGFVPDRGGFKAGFGAAWNILEPKLAEQSKLSTQLAHEHSQLKAQLAEALRNEQSSASAYAEVRTKLDTARRALEQVASHGCCVMHSDRGCPGCVAKEAVYKLNLPETPDSCSAEKECIDPGAIRHQLGIGAGKADSAKAPFDDCVGCDGTGFIDQGACIACYERARTGSDDKV